MNDTLRVFGSASRQKVAAQEAKTITSINEFTRYMFTILVEPFPAMKTVEGWYSSFAVAASKAKSLGACPRSQSSEEETRS